MTEQTRLSKVDKHLLRGVFINDATKKNNPRILKDTSKLTANFGDHLKGFLNKAQDSNNSNKSESFNDRQRSVTSEDIDSSRDNSAAILNKQVSLH
jgi:hypothetical protein